MITWIKDGEHLEQIQQKNKDFFILVFYGAFSQAAKRALNELERFNKENEKIPVYVIDVAKVKGAHKQFNVTNVPTVLGLENRKVISRIEGVQNAHFYARIFLGVRSQVSSKSEGRPPHRVIVYSTPTCPACSAAKSYFRRIGINFRDVNVANNQREAERLVQRSGQMAVPQIDIDGHLIVGFDQAKIDRFLINR